MENKLTAKQARFCEEYMVDLNATQAALRAGYSPKTANEIGCQNLAKVSIATEIARLQAITSKKLNITKESLLQDLLNIKDMCSVDAKTSATSIKAIEVINKMLGFNEADKVDTNINLKGSIKDLIKFDDNTES